ncbi:MAG: V-type ATPase subunit [Ruminococcus sp.]|nr:V-type ATPase subunit [Ruminococcus sp.]
MGTEYASAVAAVRAMECSLLSPADIEQLIGADSAEEFNGLLDAKKSAQSSLTEVWEMLRSYAPDNEELKILLYRNDFHNLKAALKSVISGRNAEDYFVYPSNFEPKLASEAFAAKDYAELPEYMRKTASEAYELLTETMDGQLSDSFIDKAALTAMLTAADKCRSSFIKKYAELMAVCADIKIAYRCALMGKSRKFAESALCGTEKLEKDTLAEASVEGIETLLSYIEEQDLEEAAEALRESPAQFEKWCDDVLMELAETARSSPFGYEPLAAYYIAKEAEIKNIRIIKVCRESGSDKNTVMERMRRLYV